MNLSANPEPSPRKSIEIKPKVKSALGSIKSFDAYLTKAKRRLGKDLAGTRQGLAIAMRSYLKKRGLDNVVKVVMSAKEALEAIKDPSTQLVLMPPFAPGKSKLKLPPADPDQTICRHTLPFFDLVGTDRDLSATECIARFYGCDHKVAEIVEKVEADPAAQNVIRIGEDLLSAQLYHPRNSISLYEMMSSSKKSLYINPYHNIESGLCFDCKLTGNQGFTLALNISQEFRKLAKDFASCNKKALALHKNSDEKSLKEKALKGLSEKIENFPFDKNFLFEVPVMWCAMFCNGYLSGIPIINPARKSSHTALHAVISDRDLELAAKDPTLLNRGTTIRTARSMDEVLQALGY